MKKIVYVIVVFFCVGVLVYFLSSYFNKLNLIFQEQASPPEELTNAQEKEVWLNIFVHGSFGTMLGMLSLSKVAKDDVKGSWYHEIIRDMRKDPKFFTEQTILKKGLLKITPTLDPADLNNQRLAAYPITKAFDEIIKKTNPNQINNYYVFGWTGLISQKRRRLEAVRFYNEICEEYKQYENKGIKPKIRILTHSHGGNLCLNLAAVNYIIQQPTNALQVLNKNKNEHDSLIELLNLIKTLPNKEVAKLKGKMKKYDYLPLNKDLKVQELVLLGVPIQPETENFCNYDFFEKIYNIYSTKDYVQQIDFISTKQGYSSQRISPRIAHNQNKIIQARVMIGRSMKKEKINILDKPIKNDAQKQEASETLFNKIISSAQAYFADGLKDPTHKDLWFAAWGRENESSLSPLPIIVLIPLITKTLSCAKNTHNDFDVNIKKSKDGKYLKFQVSKYDEFRVEVEELFPFDIIDRLKKDFGKWKPIEDKEKDTNLALIFNNINAKFNNILSYQVLEMVKKI
ncbi:MAG: hypothetical protein US49_C0001G0034 [candidate division TM6 bacterium GW2011_GWF2_37_49]|nr:MAG: hypothetical protein US49_C0001G0034 [candidate division TM6 bacterium GW2011_GWF2_37_49]